VRGSYPRERMHLGCERAQKAFCRTARRSTNTGKTKRMRADETVARHKSAWRSLWPARGHQSWSQCVGDRLVPRGVGMHGASGRVVVSSSPVNR
jgi:hypothetical protein